ATDTEPIKVPAGTQVFAEQDVKLAPEAARVDYLTYRLPGANEAAPSRRHIVTTQQPPPALTPPVTPHHAITIAALITPHEITRMSDLAITMHRSPSSVMLVIGLF
ncbi:MAG: hypothetical protein MSS97_05550, partial [Arcanobacterium sp.]|nr:hypothetical protein [Arcanobacterium sp.]